DGGWPEGLTDAHDGIDADHLSIPAAEIDLAQVGLALEGGLVALDAQIVTLAITRIVIVLGGIDATDHHVDGACDLGGRKTEISGTDAVDVKLVLGQFEVEIQIHIAHARFYHESLAQFLGEPAHFIQIRAAYHELERFA